jgi:hypothetical protein
MSRQTACTRSTDTEKHVHVQLLTEIEVKTLCSNTETKQQGSQATLPFRIASSSISASGSARLAVLGGKVASNSSNVFPTITACFLGRKPRCQFRYSSVRVLRSCRVSSFDRSVFNVEMWRSTWCVSRSAFIFSFSSYSNTKSLAT